MKTFVRNRETDRQMFFYKWYIYIPKGRNLKKTN